MEYTMDEWWASLTVDEKERIGGKITKRDCSYPECTTIWNRLDRKTQTQIHNHCVNKHGDEMSPWQDGVPYSY